MMVTIAAMRIVMKIGNNGESWCFIEVTAWFTRSLCITLMPEVSIALMHDNGENWCFIEVGMC